MSKAPAFQFYASDFLTDTNSWDAIEVGIYIRILSTQWVNGSVPDDEVRLARIAGVDMASFKKAWVFLGLKFELYPDGQLRNPKMEEVRNQQNLYRETARTNGKKGGRPKKKTQHETENKPNENPTLLKNETEIEPKKNHLEVEDEIEDIGLKEGGTGGTNQGFLIIPELDSIWKAARPNYASSRSMDYPELGEILNFLVEHHRVHNPDGTRLGFTLVIETWTAICATVANHNLFSKYNLNQVRKYIQSIMLEIGQKSKPEAAKKQGLLQKNIAANQSAHEKLNKILNTHDTNN